MGYVIVAIVAFCAGVAAEYFYGRKTLDAVVAEKTALTKKFNEEKAVLENKVKELTAKLP